VVGRSNRLTPTAEREEDLQQNVSPLFFYG